MLVWGKSETMGLREIKIVNPYPLTIVYEEGNRYSSRLLGPRRILWKTLDPPTPISLPPTRTTLLTGLQLGR